MTESLNVFADKFTRVARWLGGQARVTGVAGTWKDNVNTNNPTLQVRTIADAAVSC